MSGAHPYGPEGRRYPISEVRPSSVGTARSGPDAVRQNLGKEKHSLRPESDRSARAPFVCSPCDLYSKNAFMARTCAGHTVRGNSSFHSIMMGKEWTFHPVWSNLITLPGMSDAGGSLKVVAAT